MNDDPYISEEVLSTGPSGKVYRGHDVAGSTLVRIKALLTDADVTCPVDRNCVRSRLPQVLALQHPQVCRLIALDEREGDLALVSELSPGYSLSHLITFRALGALDIRALASQLVMALQVGEMHGLHHGDVKPSNVIIADHPNGTCSLQLQDWGLADCRHDQPNETLCNRAPERLNGAPASAQSDLFSLGATIAAMLIGRTPIHGETPEQLFSAWASFDPMLLRHARPDVDPALHDWLAWLLNVDPAYRPVSAAQAQDVLVSGAMMASFMPPLKPVYQMPGMQPWQAQEAPQPQEFKPAETASLGPAAPKPRSPTPLPTHVTQPLVKKKRGISFCIIFSLSSLVLFADSFIWVTTLWGADWPQHLRNEVASMMGGSANSDPTATPSTTVPPAIKGQIVRVEMPGKATLNLAEVEVFSFERNLAPEGKASAKDSAFGAEPQRANDGKTSGDWKDASIYHSKDNSTSPWWEVDLGSEQPINAVKVWNRTDGKYAERLKNYSIIILGKDRRVLWRIDKQPTPSPNQRHEVGPSRKL